MTPVPLASTTADGSGRHIQVCQLSTGLSVVHGTYGLVLTNGRRYEHLALSWTAAIPAAITVILTDATTGVPISWHIPRNLVHSGGKFGPFRVDHAGAMVFLVQTWAAGQTWITLDRNWIVAFLVVTERICKIAS